MFRRRELLKRHKISRSLTAKMFRGNFNQENNGANADSALLVHPSVVFQQEKFGCEQLIDPSSVWQIKHNPGQLMSIIPDKNSAPPDQIRRLRAFIVECLLSSTVWPQLVKKCLFLQAGAKDL